MKTTRHLTDAEREQLGRPRPTHWTESNGSPRVDPTNATPPGDDEGIRLLVLNAAMVAAEREGGATNGGMGQRALARLLGRNHITVFRWASGAKVPPYEAQVVMRLIIWQGAPKNNV